MQHPLWKSLSPLFQELIEYERQHREYLRKQDPQKIIQKHGYAHLRDQNQDQDQDQENQPTYLQEYYDPWFLMRRIALLPHRVPQRQHQILIGVPSPDPESITPFLLVRDQRKTSTCGWQILGIEPMDRVNLIENQNYEHINPRILPQRYFEILENTHTKEPNKNNPQGPCQIPLSNLHAIQGEYIQRYHGAANKGAGPVGLTQEQLDQAIRNQADLIAREGMPIGITQSEYAGAPTHIELITKDHVQENAPGLIHDDLSQGNIKNSEIPYKVVQDLLEHASKLSKQFSRSLNNPDPELEFPFFVESPMIPCNFALPYGEKIFRDYVWYGEYPKREPLQKPPGNYPYGIYTQDQLTKLDRTPPLLDARQHTFSIRKRLRAYIQETMETWEQELPNQPKGLSLVRKVYQIPTAWMREILKPENQKIYDFFLTYPHALITLIANCRGGSHALIDMPKTGDAEGRENIFQNTAPKIHRAKIQKEIETKQKALQETSPGFNTLSVAEGLAQSIRHRYQNPPINKALFQKERIFRILKEPTEPKETYTYQRALQELYPDPMIPRISRKTKNRRGLKVNPSQEREIRARRDIRWMRRFHQTLHQVRPTKRQCPMEGIDAPWVLPAGRSHFSNRHISYDPYHNNGIGPKATHRPSENMIFSRLQEIHPDPEVHALAHQIQPPFPPLLQDLPQTRNKSDLHAHMHLLSYLKALIEHARQNPQRATEIHTCSTTLLHDLHHLLKAHYGSAEYPKNQENHNQEFQKIFARLMQAPNQHQYQNMRYRPRVLLWRNYFILMERWARHKKTIFLLQGETANLDPPDLSPERTHALLFGGAKPTDVDQYPYALPHIAYGYAQEDGDGVLIPHSNNSEYPRVPPIAPHALNQWPAQPITPLVRDLGRDKISSNHIVQARNGIYPWKNIDLAHVLSLQRNQPAQEPKPEVRNLTSVREILQTVSRMGMESLQEAIPRLSDTQELMLHLSDDESSTNLSIYEVRIQDTRSLLAIQCTRDMIHGANPPHSLFWTRISKSYQETLPEHEKLHLGILQVLNEIHGRIAKIYQEELNETIRSLRTTEDFKQSFHKLAGHQNIHITQETQETQEIRTLRARNDQEQRTYHKERIRNQDTRKNEIFEQCLNILAPDRSDRSTNQDQDKSQSESRFCP